MWRSWLSCVLCAALLATSLPARAYSVLTHEEIIDMAWEPEILPLLRQRFPNASVQELNAAHAYAYGGSVIQDLGYYPFGSRDFSNLLHYVRSGDFVTALLANAQTPEEYAFALGALAHYASDVKGHPAINRAEAIEYPKLAAKYHAHSISFEQNPVAHVQTEFGFDMVQVAKGRYSAGDYRNYIGFEVARPLLERTFQQIYGMPLNKVIAHEDLAIGSYRHAVSNWIPDLTRAAVRDRRAQLAREIPDFSEKKFLFNVSRADYERSWGTDYRKPGLGARIIVFLSKLLPRFGPFRELKFKVPTPATEDMYFKSVNDTLAYYRECLHALRDSGRLALPNLNLDTASATRAGEYALADKTHARLLHALRKQNFAQMNSALSQRLLAFYASDGEAALTHRDQRKRAARDLEELRKHLSSANARAPATSVRAADTAPLQ
jgi:hypothetical protein